MHNVHAAQHVLPMKIMRTARRGLPKAVIVLHRALPPRAGRPAVTVGTRIAVPDFAGGCMHTLRIETWLCQEQLLSSVSTASDPLQVPTFVFYRSGKEVGRHVGSSRGDLIGQILMQQNALGIAPPPPPVKAGTSRRRTANA